MTELQPQMRDRLVEVMNSLDMVRWDRAVTGTAANAEASYAFVYGWIGRDDGRSDFVLLESWSHWNGDIAATTSSAHWSREIQRRVRGSDEGHVDCVRVADMFGDAVTNRVGT